jgi:magnesium transporter
MITYYYKALKDSKPEILSVFRIGSWVDVENPTENELEKLSAEFSLEMGHLKDALDPYEVPRLEIGETALYIFTRVPHLENGRTRTIPVLVIIGADFTMTVSRRPLPFLEKFTQGKIKFFTTQKAKLFIQLFSEINSSYAGFLTDTNRHVRNMSGKLTNIENQDIIELVSFETVLNDFLTDLVPTSAILNNLLSGKFFKLFEEDRELVQDLSLSNGQLVELCKATLRTIVNTREGYSAIMTNNLNRVIKLLTALTIVLTIPTIIASLYGMNVTLPFADSPFAFLGVIAFTIVIVLIILGTFVKNRWL